MYFYRKELSGYVGSGYAYAQALDHEEFGGEERCSLCNAVIRGSLNLSKNYKLSSGRLSDVIMNISHGFLVSRRFMEAWISEQMTGIEAFIPVEVTKARGRSSAVADLIYYQALIEAPTISLDFKLSQCKLKNKHVEYQIIWDELQICPECRNAKIKHPRLDRWMDCIWAPPEKWVLTEQPPKDIYTLKNYPGEYSELYLLSDRFVDFVKRHGFTNWYALTVEQLIESYRYDLKEDYPFSELCPSSDPKEKTPASVWSEARTHCIKVNVDALRLDDYAEVDEEIEPINIPIIRGNWEVIFSLDEHENNIERVEMHHLSSCCSLGELKRYGTIGVDSGMIYIRPFYPVEKQNDLARELIMGIDVNGSTKQTEHSMIEIRKVFKGVLFYAGHGDGSYTVYVDNATKAGIIRLELSGWNGTAGNGGD